MIVIEPDLISAGAARITRTIIAWSSKRMTRWCGSMWASYAWIPLPQVQALAELYERMWVYYNLFQPVLHLSQKQLSGDKVKRKWDRAQTPYERVLTSGVLSPEQQARLQQLYEQTNPLALRQEIYRRLAELWDMPSAASGTAA